MAGRGKKNNIKAKQIVEKRIVPNQLELTQTKTHIEESEEDNESININQIEPKKIELN